MKKISISPIALALAAVLIAGGTFVGGMKYQEMKRPAFARGGFNAQTGTGGPGQGGQGGRQGNMRFGQGSQLSRPVNGEIINSDDKSITVKLMDGSSKIILFSDSTTINKAADATKTDLKNGEKVAVFGPTNPDGSVTAQNIQLNPMFRTMGNATPSASPTVK